MWLFKQRYGFHKYMSGDKAMEYGEWCKFIRKANYTVGRTIWYTMIMAMFRDPIGTIRSIKRFVKDLRGYYGKHLSY